MEKTSLQIKTSTGRFSIDTSTIVRIEASSNYSRVYFSNGKVLVTAKVLKWFEEKLQHQPFVRLHRSHLVNNDFMYCNQRIGSEVEMKDGTMIQVSKRRKKAIWNKFFALLLVLLFVKIEVTAQNVGIGTVSPAGRLHIDLNGATTPYAILVDDDDDDATIRFRRLGISKWFLQSQGNDFRMGTYSTNDSGRLILATNSLNRIYISPGGNTGIGIAEPVSKLQVIGGNDVNLVSSGYFTIGNVDGTNMVFDNNEIQARNDSSSSSLFIQSEGGRTQFGSSSDNNIEIDGINIQAKYNGAGGELVLQGLDGGKTRLGSGLDFATTKFHISTGGDAGLASNQSGYMMIGSSNGLNLVFDNNEILARDNGVASALLLAREGSRVQLGNGTEAIGTKLHVSSGNDVDLTDGNSGYILIGSTAGGNIAIDNNEIQARSNGAATNLFLQNSGGNVRIGNGSFLSTHKLGVAGDVVVTGGLRVGDEILPAGYKFGVDGKAICTELLVRLVPNWPDYVFNKNYQLPELNEVENFIRKNNHLPGIPSAKTIETNGLNIGEMQKLQMQKIEELTLYIIELKKEIEKLKTQQ
ncbi:LytTR family transcriptional regulator DNA-binding domain-containing protein [Ferruginibacter sp.]